MTETTRLSRKLNSKDAIIIGLSAMIGSGIFAAIGPATLAAGSGVLFGIIIAGLIAYLNATSMAQLAAVYPESGGTYVYGGKQLGEFWGFIAGWGFIIGKIASCSAMALTFGYYASESYGKPLAILAVLALTFVNYLGVKKTALVTRILVSVVLVSLAIMVIASLSGGTVDSSRLSNWTIQGGFRGILESAGLMFFAFAGYARVATLGEEVIKPKETIPKAIMIALGFTILIYLLVITASLLTLDAEVIANSKAPLEAVLKSTRFSFLSPIVQIGACFGSIGVLLALLAGISRTMFAMAANHHLPHFLSRVHPKHKVPHYAEVIVGVIVAVIVGFVDLRSAIGFSSFSILTYYAIGNLSAWTLEKKNRLWPYWMSLLGFFACVVIAFNLPKQSILGGVFVFSVGILYFGIKKFIGRKKYD